MNVIVNSEKKVPLCIVPIETTKWYCHLDRSLAFNVFIKLRTLCWPRNVMQFTVYKVCPESNETDSRKFV